MEWVLGILIFVVLCVLAFGFYLARFSVTGKRQTLDEAEKWQNDAGDITWYKNYKTKDYKIKSYDGYVINAQFIKNKHKSNRYVIISHGYTDNRIGALKYADTYLDLGFNVIVYDLRGHGLNEKTFTSYSIRESKDLLQLINDAYQRYSGIETLGIHGESLGAATSIMVLKYKPKIDFAVADCGFSNITEVLSRGLSGMHIPSFMVKVASLCCRIRYGYFYSQMRPIEALKDNTVPILFIHGEKDNFIVPEHSLRMKEETAGYSEMYLAAGAEHAMSVFADKQKYHDTIKQFLKNIKVIKEA